MVSVQFWKSWPAVDRRLFWLFASAVVFTVLFLWISNLDSPTPVFPAAKNRQLETASFTTHSFHVGTMEVSVPTEAYIVFERTQGGLMNPNRIAPYIFLGVLVIGTIGLLGLISGLSRLWFYAGVGLFALFIISLRIDSVLLFAFSNKIPTALVLVSFGIPSYYLQFIKTGLPFAKRLWIFAAVTVALLVLFSLTGHTQQPLLHLSANGIAAGTILMVIFIFSVAHEILAFVVTLVSQGNRQTKSLRHFLIISAIYLINLIVIYLNRKHFIVWSFFPVSLFLFVTLSGIVGLWGFRRREPQYSGIMQANPVGVLFYLSLAAIGFSTIGYFIATENDPLIQLAQDAILYSHLGYGLIFFVYVVSNFGSMLSNNLQVYRVLYKPTNMPYFTFRFAGLIVTFALFAASNWKVTVDQVYAGYYNAKGDVYFSNDTLTYGDGYYQRSLLYALRNYHAHYALAQISALRGESEKEKTEYQRLVDSRPLDLAYLNLSGLYESSNSLQQSANILRQGLRDFPKNSRLQNELGMVYAQMNRQDSAWLLVQLARSSSSMKSEAEANLFGLAAKFNLPFPVDSLLRLFGEGNRELETNALALGCVQRHPLVLNAAAATDTALTANLILTLHNNLLNHLDQPDTALISRAIRLGQKNSNPLFKGFLLSAAAHATYANGQILTAITILREAAFAAQDEKYYDVLGLWTLEQNAPASAVPYFDEASKQDSKAAVFHRAIGLSELTDMSAARTAWDSLQRAPDTTVRHTAKKMLAVLTASPEQILSRSDEEKYLYSRCRVPLDNNGEFESIMAAIRDPEIRARGIVDRCKKFDEADEIDGATQTLAQVRGLALHDKQLYDEIIQLNLLFLARQGKWQALKEQMKSGISFQRAYRLNEIYLNALLSAQAGRKDEATKSFQMLAMANPFFEDAIVTSVDSLMVDAKDKLRIYSTLVNSLELNPNSIKLLKAYVLLSVELEFAENAQTSLDKLRTLMLPVSFLKFVQENQESMVIKPN